MPFVCPSDCVSILQVNVNWQFKQEIYGSRRLIRRLPTRSICTDEDKQRHIIVVIYGIYGDIVALLLGTGLCFCSKRAVAHIHIYIPSNRDLIANAEYIWMNIYKYIYKGLFVFADSVSMARAIVIVVVLL